MTRKVQVPDELKKEQKDATDVEIRDKPWDNERYWLYRVRVFFLIFGASVTAIVLAVFFWHLLAPPSWRWLAIDEFDRISNFALSIVVGLLVSAMTTYFFSNRR